MFKRKHHVSLTLAALMALSACGSGSDSGGADAGISPQSGVSTKAAASTATAAQSLKDGTAIQAAANAGNLTAVTEAAQASEPAGAVPAAAPEAATPPIGNDSVRGDVVLTMLAQRTCAPMALSDKPLAGTGLPEAQQEEYPEVVADGGFDSANYSPSGKPEPRWPWTENPKAEHVGGAHNPTCASHFFQSYTPMGNGFHTLHEYSKTDYDQDSHKNATRLFDSWDGRIPIVITDDGFLLSDHISFDITFDRGTKEHPKVNNQTSADVTKLNDMYAGTDKVFSAKRTSAVRYGTLQRWSATPAGQNPQERVHQLLLLKGEQGEAKLCWNIDTEWVKRLQCRVFRVPDGWTYGDPLTFMDQYVIDDRTPVGETGLINLTYHGAVVKAKN